MILSQAAVAVQPSLSDKELAVSHVRVTIGSGVGRKTHFAPAFGYKHYLRVQFSCPRGSRRAELTTNEVDCLDCLLSHKYMTITDVTARMLSEKESVRTVRFDDYGFGSISVNGLNTAAQVTLPCDYCDLPSGHRADCPAQAHRFYGSSVIPDPYCSQCGHRSWDANHVSSVTA